MSHLKKKKKSDGDDGEATTYLSNCKTPHRRWTFQAARETHLISTESKN